MDTGLLKSICKQFEFIRMDEKQVYFVFNGYERKASVNNIDISNRIAIFETNIRTSVGILFGILTLFYYIFR